MLLSKATYNYIQVIFIFIGTPSIDKGNLKRQGFPFFA